MFRLALVALLAAAVAPSLAAPSSFVHPGVGVSRAQLNFTKTMVNSKQEPWSDAWNQLLSSGFVDLTREPSPRATVEYGSYSNPNLGCTDERQDAIAAYSCALAWYITSNAQYATKAISYFDAWSGTLQSHNNSNAPLQTGWAGASWPKAAEIIRYTYDGWSESSIQSFSNMLRNVYLPELIKGSNSNGNWELVMMEAAVGISVFLEDSESYDAAMSLYSARVPAYVYLSSDGPLPKTVASQNLNTEAKIVKYWQGQSTFVDGIAQETCRDFTHTGYGIASISNVAETSRIQGNDLYTGNIGTRLRYALDFHSQYELGADPPSWLCNGTLNLGLGPITEVGYNAMSFRLGNVMTNTGTLTEKQRPAGTDLLFVAWGTLTNAEQPN